MSRPTKNITELDRTMNEPTTEQLMAFADGELSPAEHQQIAAQVAASPALQEIVAQFENSRTLLREVFDERLDEPVPQHMIDAVRNYQPRHTAAPDTAPEIKPLPGAGQPQTAHAATRRPAANYSRMAIAATVTLTIGILAGLMLQGGDNAPPRVYAGTDAAMLQVAMETRASGETLGGRRSAITPQASYTVRDGGVCREYNSGATAEQIQAQGLACRGNDGQWRIETEIAFVADPDGHFTPALGDHDSIAEALDRLGASAGLNTADEAHLLQNHWQTP